MRDPDFQQPRKFTTTRWSVVRAAADRPTAHSREALATLCRLYWYPVYAFIRSSGRTSEDAHDLTQAFFLRLLEDEGLGALDPSRGRFRSWLLACVKNFLANERGREAAQKRGGGVAPVSIDAAAAEGQYQLEPSHQLTPERLYERRWTLTLLEQVLGAVRQRYVERGKEPLFLLLKGALTEGDASWSPVEAARALGMKEGAVRVAVFRLRQLYKELFRQAVADTVEDPASVEDEISRLLSGL